MTLNWNLLVILILISGIIGIITGLIAFFAPSSKKVHSLKYIGSTLIIGSISIFLDGISILFMNDIIALISGLLFFPCAVSLSIGINYILKETYNSIYLILVICLGVLLCYFAFLPGAVKPIVEEGYLTFFWTGLFGLMTDILTLVIYILLLYWGFLTWKNAPFLIKKEASLFFIGICIITLLPAILTLFRSQYHLIFNLLSYSCFSIGSIIFVYSIIKEPKLLYILPFTVYRILVKDKEGYPLFDHDWSESDISEVIFTGFINAVQLMSEEVMNIGGLVDINLEEGILILHESPLITVGLVSSKSSKLLRDTLVNFSKDFEELFERQLKQKINDKSIYEPAYLLIDKYFLNFPFRLIRSKKHPLLLSGKSTKTPFELESKFRDIFSDEKEFKSIIAEISKSPLSVPEEFINLYEDLKKEMDHLPEDDIKELDNRQDNI
ncbi:MAG: hypothetical protein ACFFDK_04930 [Promethearchaeota archaeon]